MRSLTIYARVANMVATVLAGQGLMDVKPFQDRIGNRHRQGRAPSYGNLTRWQKAVVSPNETGRLMDKIHAPVRSRTIE